MSRATMLPALLAAGMIGLGVSPHGRDLAEPEDDFIVHHKRGNRVARIILNGAPNRPTFTSEQPLTKRQRRRQRGKAKP